METFSNTILKLKLHALHACTNMNKVLINLLLSSSNRDQYLLEYMFFLLLFNALTIVI